MSIAAPKRENRKEQNGIESEISLIYKYNQHLKPVGFWLKEAEK